MGDFNKFLTDFKEVYNQLNYNGKKIYLHFLKFYLTESVDDNEIDEKPFIIYFHEQEDEKYFLN